MAKKLIERFPAEGRVIEWERWEIPGPSCPDFCGQDAGKLLVSYPRTREHFLAGIYPANYGMGESWSFRYDQHGKHPSWVDEVLAELGATDAERENDPKCSFRMREWVSR